ncbi:MAG: N-acetylmuramoyl-L-alanine amidase [Bacteroidales bacterium]|nr:N-acetylmuramoyl-L-alanine amidase [Bacteroidales bacterium]
MKRLFALFIALICINGVVFSQKKSAGQVKTVVIDAGHGGAKPGAIGHQSKEKNLTLSMALKLGKVIEDNYPDVKIIYTRTTDADITLAERARIANRAKADLFLSIHCNSWANSTPTGVETYVMGLSQSKANMEVAKKENADILLEKDYKDNSEYQGFDPNSPESYVMFAMYQNAYLDKSLDFAGYIQEQYKSAIKTINRGVKQAEIFVLYKTAMPAVLTEVGFISNPEEERYMMSDEGQATIVASIFKAFVKYKSTTEGVKAPTNLKIDLKGYNSGKKEVKKEEPKPVKPAEPAEAPKEAAPEIPSAMVVSTAQTGVEPPLPIAEPELPKSVTEPLPPASEEDEFQSATPQKETAAASSNGVVYKVQFLSSDKKLKEGSREFKGLKDYEYYIQNGAYRYTTGSFRNVRDASTYQKEIRALGFSDAFVVAFIGDRRITLQQAKEMENR